MDIPTMNQKAFKKILPLLMVEMLVEEIREKVFQIKKTIEINHQKKESKSSKKKLNLARRKKTSLVKNNINNYCCDYCSHDWFLCLWISKGR